MKARQKYLKISDFSQKVKMKTGGIWVLFVCFFILRDRRKTSFPWLVMVIIEFMEDG